MSQLGWGGRRIHALNDDPCVLRGGDGREDGDGAEQVAAQEELIEGGPDLIDEDDGEAEDLDDGVSLPSRLGRKSRSVPVANSRVEMSRIPRSRLRRVR